MEVLDSLRERVVLQRLAEMSVVQDWQERQLLGPGSIVYSKLGFSQNVVDSFPIQGCPDIGLWRVYFRESIVTSKLVMWQPGVARRCSCFG